MRPGAHNADWRVQIFWPFCWLFRVLYAEPQCGYVLFGEDNRQPDCICSRAPTLSEIDYNALLDQLAGLGYDPRRFLKVIQTPEQIRQPGSWNDSVKPAKAPRKSKR